MLLNKLAKHCFAYFVRKCEEKTAKCNVYRSKPAAKRAASRLKRKTHKDIMSFRCPCCRKWHLGKRKTFAEQKVVKHIEDTLDKQLEELWVDLGGEA